VILATGVYRIWEQKKTLLRFLNSFVHHKEEYNDEVHSAVGPSLLGVRRLGTHYRTVSVIHRSAAAALGVV